MSLFDSDSFDVDIEAPHKDIETMPLAQVRRKYNLDERDIELLRDGGLVKIGEIYLSKAEE